MERTQRLLVFPLKKILGILLLLLLAPTFIFLSERLGIPTYFSQIAFLRVKDVAWEISPPLAEKDFATITKELKERNILSISSAHLVRSIKNQNWVSGVSVRKSFPDRLEIRVETKKPVAISLKDGAPWYIDANGDRIGKLSPTFRFPETFPVVSYAYRPDDESWSAFRVSELLEKMKQTIPPSSRLSEVSLSHYPIFRVFLVSPQVEILFHAETWESQLTFLQTFLKSTPTQFVGTRRINLTLSKKAVVSLPNSQ